MKNFSLFVLSISSLVFSSCTFTSTPEDSTAQLKNTNENRSVENKIKNNIVLEKNSLNVTQAFLMAEDGSLISDANSVNVGQKIKMRLVIDNGFRVINNLVKIGASEKISTNSGEIVLNESDLFSSYAEGISPADAEYITLSAEITKLDKLYDYFLIEFRVWDKQSTNEAKGSYKLYIK